MDIVLPEHEYRRKIKQLEDALIANQTLVSKQQVYIEALERLLVLVADIDKAGEKDAEYIKKLADKYFPMETPDVPTN